MYELLARLGAFIGIVVWVLLLIEALYRHVEHWMDDGDSEIKKNFVLRCCGRGSWAYRNDWEAPLFGLFLLAPGIGALLGVVVWFMFLNFFIPLAVVSFIGLAFTGRMVKRVKKGFTKHVDDKNIHVQAGE